MSASAERAKRGRPPKFGRPGQVVALTLPEEVVRGLRKLDPDLAWAIVTLFEKKLRRSAVMERSEPDSELVRVGGRRSLIVVNRRVVRHLPGVSVIPLHGSRAFLALEPGQGMPELELSVLDRLSAPSIDARERRALEGLRAQLRTWRHDRRLHVGARAIVVLERLGKSAN